MGKSPRQQIFVAFVYASCMSCATLGNESERCNSEIDRTSQSLWPESPLGLTSQPCPSVDGYFSRQCLADPSSVSGGSWGPVDISQCSETPEETGIIAVAGMDSYCPEDIDDFPGSHLLWPDTPPGTTHALQCPSGVWPGNITRLCTTDASSPSGGAWEAVDVSGCTNPVMRSFYDAKALLGNTPSLCQLRNDEIQQEYIAWLQALHTVNQRNAHAEEILDVMEDLKVIIDEATTNDTLYPSDLILGTDIMHRISLTVAGLRGIHRMIDVLAQTFGDSISSLTTDDTFHVWENSHERTNLMDTATTILSSMDLLAIGLLNTKSNPPVFGERIEWTRLRIYASNLDFEVLSYAEEYNETKKLRMIGGDNKTQIIFPAEVVNTTKNHAESREPEMIPRDDSLDVDPCSNRINVFSASISIDGLFGFYRGQYLGIQSIMNKEFSEMTNSSHSRLVGAPILSARPLGVSRDLFTNLKQPVVIIFKHDYGSDSYKGNGICSFLNMSATYIYFADAEDRWSTTGCELAEINSSHTICHCYHMTNFALIMDLFNMTLSVEHEIALTFISYVGGTLSVLGCALSVIIYEYFRLSGDCIRVHEMLAVSIMLTQITFFVGHEIVDYKVACKALAILLHIFLLSMFCWMLVEGVHLYICLVKVFRRRSNFKKYCIVGWGVPIVIVAVSVMVFLDDYGGSTLCWVTTRVLWVAFVPFVILTILINLGVLIMVLRVIHKSISRAAKDRNEDIPMAKTGAKAIIVLMPLLGLTWVFGFLSVHNSATLVFTYLFTVFNSLQGVLFFVFHCLLNNEVKRAFDRRYQGRRHSSSLGRTKSSPETRKSNIAIDRASADQGKRTAAGSPTTIKYLGPTDEKLGLPKSAQYEEKQLSGHALHDKNATLLLEDTKWKKDLDNLKWKFSKDSNVRVELGSLLDKEIHEALAAIEFAIQAEPNDDSRYITHM